MCGIAGVFGLGRPEIVAQMLQALVHRGPDDESCLWGEDHTLGTRRLAIVDPVGGRQPVLSRDDQVLACHNGEIYNHQRLRTELGGSWRSHGDAEIIPPLYQRFGLDFPRRLQGMFAIALWDRERRRGLLVRDRAGKKPLYYALYQGSLWFASEIKALLKIPGFSRKLCPEALHHYLSLAYVPPHLCIFEGISSVPPAHLLVWEKGSVESIQPYWRLDWTPLEEVPTQAEAAEELLTLLRAAIARRRARPESFFLSGGVDSSLVTALAAQASDLPLHTFTLTCEAGTTSSGQELDVACAREVAQRYHTQHHQEVLPVSQFRQHLRPLLAHFDEPFACGFATYFLAPISRRHSKVVHSGDGADELFGSYDWHQLAGALAEWRRVGDAASFQGREGQLLLLAHLEEWKRHALIFYFSEHDKSDLYTQPGFVGDCSSLEWLRGEYSNLSAQDPLNRTLEVDFKTRLPGMILPLSDRLTMAHGLESRAPFLDTAIMEFGARLPAYYKIRAGETKAVLKQAARVHLPESCLFRPKEGFLLPANRWLRGPMLEDARQILAPERLHQHGLFCPNKVASLLDRLQAGQRGLGQKVLNLICFQIWYELYLG